LNGIWRKFNWMKVEEIGRWYIRMANCFVCTIDIGICNVVCTFSVLTFVHHLSPRRLRSIEYGIFCPDISILRSSPHLHSFPDSRTLVTIVRGCGVLEPSSELTCHLRRNSRLVRIAPPIPAARLGRGHHSKVTRYSPWLQASD
jgi:hypothetical protein